jgi:hypothetical protein
MNHAEAARRLAGQELTKVLEGSLRKVKDIHTQCLASDIPAAMVRPPAGAG